MKKLILQRKRRTTPWIMSKNAAVRAIKLRSDPPEEYKKLSTASASIEGQIRGIKGMVEKNAYCPDIMDAGRSSQCRTERF